MNISLEDLKVLSEIFANLQTGIRQNVVIAEAVEPGLKHLASTINAELLNLHKKRCSNGRKWRCGINS